MRRSRRFRPFAWDALEDRSVPSMASGPVPGGLAALVRRAPSPSPRPRPAPVGPRPGPGPVAHPLPAEEIGRQFDALGADLGAATDAYLAALAAGGQVGAADEAFQLQVYLVRRVQQMTEDLVAYFNRLPTELPRAQGPYREHRPRNAIQRFLGERLMSVSPTSLQQSLVAIPVPAGGGPAVELYQVSLTATLERSRREVLDGVRLTFAGRAVLGHGTTSPTIPAF